MESKIPSISGLATTVALTAVENKILLLKALLLIAYKVKIELINLLLLDS